MVRQVLEERPPPTGRTYGTCGSPGRCGTSMKMSDHRGWRIGVTPHADDDGRWRAGVEMFGPGTGPHTHTGILLAFEKKAESEAAVVELARRHAEAWIDRHDVSR
jgi:hypothetical protein